jgi:hypothetical protein
VSAALRISLRGYDASIIAAYRRLFPGNADVTQELLDWRFRDNPHGTGKFAIAEREGLANGIIALLPTKLRNVVGDHTLGYQAIDTCVHPSARGEGLFVKMGSLAEDPSALGGDVLWGFPNANAAPGWYRRLGWTNFGEVPLLMRPLRSSFIFGRVHPKLAAVDIRMVGKAAPVGDIFLRGSELAGAFDRLWQRVSANFGIAVDRSGSWMRWRLFDRPEGGYRSVGMKAGGELQAFVSTKIADKHDSRLCYMMEAIGDPDHPGKLVQLIRSELRHAADQGAEVALAWCPRTAPNYRAYRKAGFVPVPGRIRPIEINFGARSLVAPTAAAAKAGARWYISFLDSDTN